MELIFENLETEDIEMNPYHSMIEPIVNRNFGNKFHHHNGPNKRQHTNNILSQKYQHSTTRDNSISTETLANNIKI